MDMTLPMQSPDYFSDCSCLQDIMFSDDVEVHFFASMITKSTYQPISISTIIDTQNHLTVEHRNTLSIMLNKHTLLFDGILKVYPHRLIHQDIIQNATPCHLHAYPVAHIHLEVFKADLERLCNIGVQEPCGASQWALPTFSIPKKDACIQWVLDFQELNKVKQRSIYPLPHIQDILKCCPRYSYFSKLYFSMQYFTFELELESQKLCVILTPFGLYKYIRLPTGIKQSSDIAQEVMENLFCDLDNVKIYIDDIGCFSSTFVAHMQTLDIILTDLELNGFTVNPSKYEWAVKEIDWFGYWLTPTGIKPWSKKKNAIIAIQAPINMKQLCLFIGIVTYYCDMWP